MSYSIKITNNATNEILVDKDADAIVGAIQRGETTGVMLFSQCDAWALAAAVMGANEAIEKTVEDNVPVKLLLKMAEEYKG